MTSVAKSPMAIVRVTRLRMDLMAILQHECPGINQFER